MGGMLMATQSPKIILPVTIVLAILNVVAVGLRFLARRRKKQKVMVDDWLTVPAMLLNIGLAVVLIHGVAMHVFGYATALPKEFYDIPEKRDLLLPRTTWEEFNSKMVIAKRDEWVFFLLSIPALGLTKLSILFFYQRIFVIARRDYKDVVNVCIWAMIAIVVMWTIAFWFRYLFACGVHFDTWWMNSMMIMFECGDFNKILNALAISDFACDLVILLLPLPGVWKLHMPVTSKIAMSFVFALGSFAVVASVIRMIWCLWQATQNDNLDLDVTLLVTTFLFWNYLEVTVGLLAACIPTLRSLINTYSLDSALNSARNKLNIPSLSSFLGFSRGDKNASTASLDALASDKDIPPKTPPKDWYSEAESSKSVDISAEYYKYHEARSV
ncbi:hypothetical protein BU24DRAFT_417145 [Aaosphaeria arxii CBS 175.79]|uniref:Rhodopsin domain-containing protein n=1 Tax=Aaosphaeria arxii CBS 175.79 TaxID=1450172 RepID=A0A6A5Y869_9PLEO|nr:uncharacterized protein BU24DRAFT_417145 [Aaosphaeria arxii CBS 175.79]KAF2021506.1 hypothetical protein BU24DRAFT_417145 [Aaosphaeria arxii CBS 175.79]